MSKGLLRKSTEAKNLWYLTLETKSGTTFVIEHNVTFDKRYFFGWAGYIPPYCRPSGNRFFITLRELENVTRNLYIVQGLKLVP